MPDDGLVDGELRNGEADGELVEGPPGLGEVEGGVELPLQFEPLGKLQQLQLESKINPVLHDW